MRNSTRAFPVACDMLHTGSGSERQRHCIQEHRIQEKSVLVFKARHYA